MKILVIAHKPPFPRIDGGCMATAQLVSGLESQGMDYKLALIETQKHPFSLAHFPQEIGEKVVLHHRISTEGLMTNVKALFNGQHSIFTARFFNSDFAQKLIDYCQSEAPDIIHFESLYAAVYFNVLREKSNAKFVLRTHNVEHQLWEDRLKHAGFIKKFILKKQVQRLKTEELEIFKKMDGLVAIAKNEVDFVNEKGLNSALVWIPSGVEMQSKNSSYSNDFFHLGAMDWEPNVLGLRWFLKHVWLTYSERNSNVLHLAGKALQTDEYATVGVKNHGTVHSSQQFMCDHGIMLVPLFEGSGLRIKIIEAGSLGIPIVATTKAVEGIGLSPGVHFLEANTAESFSAAMLLLSNDVSLRRKIGEALRSFVQNNFNQHDLNRRLIEFYSGL